MAQDELLDWCDESGRWRGVAARREIHARGLWHRTLHLWLVMPGEGGSIVYQLRSRSAASWPGKLDASVAGHLLAGEAYGDALREAREELGIEVPQHSVVTLGERREQGPDPSGGWNREIQGVRIARCDGLWQTFDPTDGEAAGLVRIGHEAASQLFSDKVARVACEALIAGDGAVRATLREVTTDDFVPRPASYYLAIHNAARGLVRGMPEQDLVEAFNRRL